MLRGEATTGSGDHAVTDGGLLPLGHRTDDPSRPQINGMTGSLDPLGMPLATEVLAGERADEGFYLPIIERSELGLGPPWLLLVGDGQMRAWATRADVAGRQHVSLSPLRVTGTTAEAMAEWSRPGSANDRTGDLERSVRRHHRDAEVLAAEG